MNGSRQRCRADKGEPGSSSVAEDLPWIVTRNCQSVAASGMRSTSAQSSTPMTPPDYAIKIQSDRDHPTESIMKYVPARQRTLLYQSQEGPRCRQHYRRTSSTTRNSTTDPAAAGGEVSPRTSEANLSTNSRSDDVTLAVDLEL